MSTLNIPRTVIPVGTQSFGPIPIADSDSLAILTIDRTVSGGLNSLASSSQGRISVEQSSDGGASWTEIASSSASGGVYTMHGGLPVNDFSIGIPLWPGTGRQGRGIITITGPSSVAVKGTLAIT